MKFISIHIDGEGCEIPQRHTFLMIVSEEVDSQGNWIPRYAKPLKRAEDVYEEIQRMKSSCDRIVIRTSASFRGMAQKMGLKLRHAEWEVA